MSWKFDDATGREQVYIHAQKNMDTAAASVRGPQWVTRTNHAVSDLTGRPLMLFNSEGKTVWRPGPARGGWHSACPQTPATRTRAGNWTRKPTPACCMRGSGGMRNRGCAITGSVLRAGERDVPGE